MNHKTSAIDVHRAIESLRKEAARNEPSLDDIRRLADEAGHAMWALIDALDATEIPGAGGDSLAPATH